MEPEKDIFEQWREERESRSWILRQWNRFTYWWEVSGRYMITNFRVGVSNLWYWFPIIWKDRNWDYQHIFDILKHKLEAQADCIGTRNMHTTAKRDAEKMMTCVRLIDKIRDDFYQLEFSDYEKTKHWFEDIPDRPGYSTWESRQLEENFDAYFAKYPLIYKGVMSGKTGTGFRLRSNIHIAMTIAHINHDRARKLLFKILEQNIEGWWD